eukprot:s855_g18.t1
MEGQVAVRIKAQTKIAYGEELLVCGSVPQLGSWKLSDAALMQCQGEVWSLATRLPSGVRVELKLVQRPQGGQVLWHGAGPGGNANLVLETSIGRVGAQGSRFVSIEGLPTLEAGRPRLTAEILSKLDRESKHGKTSASAKLVAAMGGGGSQAASQRVVSLPPLLPSRRAAPVQPVPQALAPARTSTPSRVSAANPAPGPAAVSQEAVARSRSAPRANRAPKPRGTGTAAAARRHGQGAQVQGLEWSSPEAWRATEHFLQRLLGTAGAPTACPHCGRKFHPDSLARHSRVCVNVFQKQRKAFDALRQRVPLELLMKVRRLKAKAEVGRIPSSWRQRSRAFRHAVREARHASLAKGRPLRRGSRAKVRVENRLGVAPRPPQSDAAVEPRAAGRNLAWLAASLQAPEIRGHGERVTPHGSFPWRLEVEDLDPEEAAGLQPENSSFQLQKVDNARNAVRRLPLAAMAMLTMRPVSPFVSVSRGQGHSRVACAAKGYGVLRKLMQLQEDFLSCPPCQEFVLDRDWPEDRLLNVEEFLQHQEIKVMKLGAKVEAKEWLVAKLPWEPAGPGASGLTMGERLRQAEGIVAALLCSMVYTALLSSNKQLQFLDWPYFFIMGTSAFLVAIFNISHLWWQSLLHLKPSQVKWVILRGAFGSAGNALGIFAVLAGAPVGSIAAFRRTVALGEHFGSLHFLSVSLFVLGATLTADPEEIVATMGSTLLGHGLALGSGICGGCSHLTGRKLTEVHPSFLTISNMCQGGILYWTMHFIPQVPSGSFQSMEGAHLHGLLLLLCLPMIMHFDTTFGGIANMLLGYGLDFFISQHRMKLLTLLGSTLIFLAVLTMLFAATSSRRSSEYKAGSTKESCPECPVLDVRSPKEFQKGHVPGARNLPLQCPQLRSDEAKILLYCKRGGMRSQSMAKLLSRHGLDVMVLKGGYKAFRTWAEQILREKPQKAS